MCLHNECQSCCGIPRELNSCTNVWDSNLRVNEGKTKRLDLLLNFHCIVAQSVERPEGPSLVQLYRTDVGSNPGRGIGARNDCR